MTINTILARGVCSLAFVQALAASAYSPSDIIATYAGGKPQGYAGDAGAAAAAALYTPEYLAADAIGNVYISDSGNHTIRRVDTAGVITTIAGTGSAGYNGDNIPAIAAQLSYPAAIAFDRAGDLYVADPGNGRIRKITLSTGIISTFAGSGAHGCTNVQASQAALNGPVALAFDSAGTLYFSEAINRIVRKVSNGAVTEFAGTCTQTAFDSPYGLLTDAADNLYVADSGVHPFVWKYDSNGNRTTFAGNGANGNTGDGSAANSAGVTLTEPQGLTRDASGNIYIGSGAVVRVVTPDGIIHTADGNGAAGYAGDGGLATAAEFAHVGSLAMNGAGRLFIADISASPRLRIVGPPAPLVVTIAGAGIAATGDGVSSADGRISCPGICGANYVSGMAVILDASQASPDALYEWGNGSCRGNAPCAVFPQTIAPTAISARFSPWYIKTLLGGTAGPALHRPFGLTLDDRGNLYFTETTDCVVRKRSNSSDVLSTIAGNGVCGDLGDGMPATQAELNNPQGVVVDAAGNVYIQDAGNGVIRKVSGDGVLHTFAGGIYTGSNSPALALDSNGNLFALGSATTIVRITPDGNTHPFFTASSGEAQTLDGLASGTDGGLVTYGTVRDFNGQLDPTVLLLSKQGVFSSGFYAFGVPEVPSGLAEDRRGDTYNEYYNCSTAFTLATTTIDTYLMTAAACGYGGDDGPAVSATLNGAIGLAFGSNGWLYVADTGNNAIRVLYPDAIFTHGFEQ